MFQLKRISIESIARCLEKADRYRLLGEPAEAESICRDILRAAPGHPQALITLLLALTDQFSDGNPEVVRKANEILPLIKEEYDRRYYTGIFYEHRAVAEFRREELGAAQAAQEFLHQALAWYEKAEAVRPPGNDDALLRWNACVRMLQRHARSEPSAEVM